MFDYRYHWIQVPPPSGKIHLIRGFLLRRCPLPQLACTHCYYTYGHCLWLHQSHLNRCRCSNFVPLFALEICLPLLALHRCFFSSFSFPSKQLQLSRLRDKLSVVVAVEITQLRLREIEIEDLIRLRVYLIDDLSAEKPPAKMRISIEFAHSL